MESNIKFTQKAYKLDNIQEAVFPVEQQLTKEDLLENDETIKINRILDSF